MHSLAVHTGTAERGEQRRVNVDHATVETLREAPQGHKPGEADEVDAANRYGDAIVKRSVVEGAPFDNDRFDPALTGTINARCLRTRTDGDGDVGAQHSCFDPVL